jgi:hypothetical protein
MQLHSLTFVVVIVVSPFWLINFIFWGKNNYINPRNDMMAETSKDPTYDKLGVSFLNVFTLSCITSSEVSIGKTSNEFLVIMLK